MTSSSSNLFLIVLVYSLSLLSSGVRRRRQDFIFPDDSQPRGIPVWLLTSSQAPTFQPTSATIPSRATPSTTDAPTSTASSAQSGKTTPTPQFLRCFKSCPTTSEYNPICGTNQEVYLNEQKFLCAQRCGAVVDIVRRGNCQGVFG